MELSLFIENLRNPTLLFFLLGIISSLIRSDLEIPSSTIRFISLYLIFSIGFKGGQELTLINYGSEAILSILICLVLSVVVTLYVFYLAKKVLTVPNSGAVAATFGSVSAITFIETALFCSEHQMPYGGYMVGAMALMEVPPIITVAVLVKVYTTHDIKKTIVADAIRKTFTSSYVLLALGSLLVGIFSGNKEANAMTPFIGDLFKGFLAIFLIEMGRKVREQFRGFSKYGNRIILMAILLPFLNALISLIVTHFFNMSDGNRLLICMLCAGGSYILVPQAMKKIAPQADTQLYVPMALGIVFPVNLVLGLPFYASIIKHF